MARNGVGTYVLPAGQPVVTGTTISSTTHNTLMTDIATALTTSLASDGQTVPTANIPMGGYKITGLGNATLSTDALALGQMTASSGASLAGFIQSGTGAVATTVQTKLRECISVKDFGAVGDGSNDDTAEIQAAIDSFPMAMDGAGQSGTVFFPRGKYKISAVLTVPPGVVLEGAGQFSMTNATAGQGAYIDVTHNGVGIRFTRTNAAPGNLWHMGGMRNMSVGGPGAGSSVHLVELGDNGNVDTSHGAWGGFIHNCVFNYATTGYGIFAAHSQTWDIRNNTFKSVKYPIYYNSVAASCIIDHNVIDNSGLASGSAGCGIFMRPGTLGGSAGMTISNNYVISADYGIYLCSMLGAHVTGNVLEGIYNEPITLSKYLLDFVTADGSGCTSCVIEGNGAINWCADGAGANAAVQVSYSPDNYIGKNMFQSPNAAAGPAVSVYDATTINNIIIAPIVTGTNAGTVPPLQYNNSVLATNTIIAADWYQFSGVGAPTTASWGAGEKGRIWMESSLLRIWSKGPTGADPQKAVIPFGGNRTSTNEGATVDVTGCFTVTIRNSGAQTVTGFTDNAAYPGKTVTFYADNDSNTTFQGATLGTRGATNYLLAQYSSITFQYQSAAIGWSEQCRKAA